MINFFILYYNKYFPKFEKVSMKKPEKNNINESLLFSELFILNV